MAALRISLSTGCFFRRPILEVLEAIQESGFTLLEIASTRQHLDFADEDQVRKAADRMQSLGLEACSYHGPFGLHLDISSPDAGLREQSAAEILASLQAAARLKVRYFTLHPGPDRQPPPSDAEIGERREHTLHFLHRLAGQCREHGITLLLENKLPDQIFGGVEELLWFRESLAASEVGICFDTGHAKLAGDVYLAARRLAPFTRIIHAHDNGGGTDDHLPPGRGDLDWRRLLQILTASGFRGVISLELSGEHVQDPTEHLQEARAARQFLEEAFLHRAESP